MNENTNTHTSAVYHLLLEAGEVHLPPVVQQREQQALVTVIEAIGGDGEGGDAIIIHKMTINLYLCDNTFSLKVYNTFCSAPPEH